MIRENARGKDKGKGSIISRQNLNEYIVTLHLACTQFYCLPGSDRKTGFISSKKPSSVLRERNTYKKYLKHFSEVDIVQGLYLLIHLFSSS